MNIYIYINQNVLIICHKNEYIYINQNVIIICHKNEYIYIFILVTNNYYILIKIYIYIFILVTNNYYILIEMSMKFVPNGIIDHMSGWVQDGFRLCCLQNIVHFVTESMQRTDFCIDQKSTKGARHEFGRTQSLNCGKRDNTKMARSLLDTQRYQLRPSFRATGRLSWWGLLLIGFAGIFRLNPGPLFTNGKDVLPPNLVKSRNHGIGFCNERFALKLDRQRCCRDACPISKRLEKSKP